MCGTGSNNTESKTSRTLVFDALPCRRETAVSSMIFLASLLSSSLLAFYTGGAARGLYGRFHEELRHSQMSKSNDVSTEGTTDLEGSSPTCVSSVRKSTARHQISMFFPDLWISSDRIESILTETPFWSDELLSSHCQHITANDDYHCMGILKGGGHIKVSRWSMTNNVEIDYYKGFGGGRSTSDISSMMSEIEQIFLQDDLEYLSNRNRTNLTRAQASFKVRVDAFRHVDLSGWDNNPLHTDLGRDFLSDESIHKTQVLRMETDYQQIDIYDLLDSRDTPWRFYSSSISHENPKTYEAANAELFAPDRMLFLDGVMQSSSLDERVYHESLVHPATFAHPNPRRIAIIGGGEGATLREALRHKTVEKVTMVEIDCMMVDAARKYLPQWASCGDIQGLENDCFEDPRAELFCEDAMAWFIDRYGDEDDSDSEDESSDDEQHWKESGAPGSWVQWSEDTEDEDPFDIIVMDALDPQDNVAFADILYKNEKFFISLFNALTDDGIFVMQVGEVPNESEPPDEYSVNRRIADVIRLMRTIGFVSFHQYQEPQCGFLDPWSFLVICKSVKCRTLWYANEASKTADIHRRIRLTKSGRPSLQHVDGPTLASYQVPHVAYERVHCRGKHASEDCMIGRGYDPSMPHFTHERGGIEIKPSGVPSEPPRTYAEVDMPKGSFVGMTMGDTVNVEYEHLQVERSQMGFLESPKDQKYSGFVPTTTEVFRPAAKLSDANVGTLPSYLLREFNVNSTGAENIGSGLRHDTSFNPTVDRHRALYGGGAFVALREIYAGEELVRCPDDGAC